MLNTDYAFAVAKIRYNELSLITSQELEQLISADSVGTVYRLLADKGWQTPDDGDGAQMLEQQAETTWELLEAAAPDINVLNALIVANDFHNLKSSIKCLVADTSPERCFVRPSVTPPEQADELVREKRFDELPDFLSQAAREGYAAASEKHGNGALVDIIIDKHCLAQRIIMAKKSKVQLLKELAMLECAAADIKVAIRAAATGKDTRFMNRAMADSGLFDTQQLIEAALKGREEIASFADKTPLKGAGDAVRQGNTAFEKWCDDVRTEKIGSARSSAFGCEPLAAYYLAKDTEIKNVRIILSAKQNSLSDDVIRQRVRRTYA